MECRNLQCSHGFFPLRNPPHELSPIKYNDTTPAQALGDGGLPGAGKTTLATILARRLNAVHFNADSVRAEINKGLGFSHEDRIEQARRMGWLWDQVVK